MTRLQICRGHQSIGYYSCRDIGIDHLELSVLMANLDVATVLISASQHPCYDLPGNQARRLELSSRPCGSMQHIKWASPCPSHGNSSGVQELQPATNHQDRGYY